MLAYLCGPIEFAAEKRLRISGKPRMDTDKHRYEKTLDKVYFRFWRMGAEAVTHCVSLWREATLSWIS